MSGVDISNGLHILATTPQTIDDNSGITDLVVGKFLDMRSPQIYQLENRFQALQSALAIAQPEIPFTTTTIDP